MPSSLPPASPPLAGLGDHRQEPPPTTAWAGAVTCRTAAAAPCQLLAAAAHADPAPPPPDAVAAAAVHAAAAAAAAAPPPPDAAAVAAAVPAAAAAAGRLQARSLRSWGGTAGAEGWVCVLGCPSTAAAGAAAVALGLATPAPSPFEEGGAWAAGCDTAAAAAAAGVSAHSTRGSAATASGAENVRVSSGVAPSALESPPPWRAANRPGREKLGGGSVGEAAAARDTRTARARSCNALDAGEEVVGEGVCEGGDRMGVNLPSKYSAMLWNSWACEEDMEAQLLRRRACVVKGAVGLVGRKAGATADCVAAEEGAVVGVGLGMRGGGGGGRGDAGRSCVGK
eukprot:1136702-Pelagomonas_calceolata.AAC.3